MYIYNIEIIASISPQKVDHCLMSRVFANGPGDQGSIPGRVIPKTQKMVLDVTQHYKVSIKGNVKQSREWGIALPYTSV